MTTNTLDSTTTSSIAAAELVWLNPAGLVIGANARLDPKVDKRFLASIRERGVLEPVVGYRDDDAQVVVLYGQRRTLAATATGRASVPVILVPRPAESDRLVDQVSENEHRAALSTNDRVSAYAQMAALGLSAAQIAKRAATPRRAVQSSASGSLQARFIENGAIFETVYQNFETSGRYRAYCLCAPGYFPKNFPKALSRLRFAYRFINPIAFVRRRQNVVSPVPRQLLFRLAAPDLAGWTAIELPDRYFYTQHDKTLLLVTLAERTVPTIDHLKDRAVTSVIRKEIRKTTEQTRAQEDFSTMGWKSSDVLLTPVLGGGSGKSR